MAIEHIYDGEPADSVKGKINAAIDQVNASNPHWSPLTVKSTQFLISAENFSVKDFGDFCIVKGSVQPVDAVTSFAIVFNENFLLPYTFSSGFFIDATNAIPTSVTVADYIGGVRFSAEVLNQDSRYTDDGFTFAVMLTKFTL